MSKSKNKNIVHIFILLVACFTLVGLTYLYTNGIDPRRMFASEPQTTALTGSVLIFPQDHAPHPDYDAEWWYINMVLNLVDDSGKRIQRAHVMSLSRILGNDFFLVSDFAKGSQNFQENTYSGDTNIVYTPTGIGYEFASNEGNGIIKPTNVESDGTYKFQVRGSFPEIPEFDLVLEIPKFDTPLLWGCDGNISVFRDNDTYYYSAPSIKVSGTVKYSDGISYTVNRGNGWMDHQWFNGGPTSSWKGHYWGSVNAGKSKAFGFVSQVYDTGQKYSYWVARDRSQNLCGDGVSVSVVENWSNGYPKRIELDMGNGNYLNIRNFSDNQIFSPPAGPDFYEPMIRSARGRVNGRLFTGQQGFFETHLKNQ